MITGVAVLCHDGRMWALPAPARHGNLFALAAFQGADAEPCTQGFVTADGVFVDREKARIIAEEYCQVLPGKPPGPLLFSEDVW